MLIVKIFNFGSILMEPIKQHSLQWCTSFFNRAGIIMLAVMVMATAQVYGIDKIHFLIPGGAGGGWDGTARGTGEALTNAGIVKSASYENMSGGGGGKAIAHLIETASRQDGTLMVNSTPIVIRSLQKVFPQSFRDLTPVAGTIGDYAALVVRDDSKFDSFKQVARLYKKTPRGVIFGGGSVSGSMDHLVAALIMQKVGNSSPTNLKYVPYNGEGGKAMAGLLSGEIEILSTGFSEAVAAEKQGQVRILCVTSRKRVPVAKHIPTCLQAGAKGAEFVNWRGFFGPPGLSAAKQAEYVAALEKMYKSSEWEAVRSRNGWVNIFNSGDKFVAFLEEQEKLIGNLMRELGFLQ